MNRTHIGCAIPGCEEPHAARGWCQHHYDGWRHYGDPLAARRATTAPNEARDYFYAHLDDATDECMIWPYALGGPGYLAGLGYGKLSIGGRLRSVHVLACEHHHGPKPFPRAEAIHGPCHAPACWNGRHLSWGSRSENQLDRHRDGSAFMRGERTNRAKLTEAQAVEIIARWQAGGIDQGRLAREYGIARNSVSQLVNGRTWPHLHRRA